MLLDKSSVALLTYLMDLTNPETVMAISRTMGQSRRKIYYHLEKINTSLPATIEPIVNFPRVGILLTKEQKVACQDLLDSVDSYSYAMSMEERIQLMTIYIAITSERVTIEKLMALTDVSRNTVLNDLSEIRAQLKTEQFKVYLYATKSEGYFFKCHPLNKIQYIHSLLYEVFSNPNEGFLTILNEKVPYFEGCELLFSPEIVAFLAEQVNQLEVDLGKKINHYEIEFMLKVLPYLLLAYRNMTLKPAEQAEIKREFGLIRKRIEYKAAQNLAASLAERFKVVLDEIEISLIAMLLLSYRKDKDLHTNSQDFAEIKATLECFVDEFLRCSAFEIDHRETLMRNLVMHAKAFLFRKTYGILSRNPLTRQIKQKYNDLFVTVKVVASYTLEEEWLVRMNDDDIAYFTIHIGGALKNKHTQGTTVQEIYLVCDEGVGVQKLLYKQCQSYLPPDSIKAVFTTEQFHSVEDILDMDLLISTSDSLRASFPVLQVQPILTYEDVMKINHFLTYHTMKESSKQFRPHLEQLLSRYLTKKRDVQEVAGKIQELIQDDLLLAKIEDSHLKDLY
ncbi:ascorbate 6-phosphate lactonase [Streptococcus cuniculi]|uniref:Ascorbate 6-phosphate lactonase n=1 Tax=Streptococcus cuniculi TaxID=1432788 RepID=A0A1Q8E6W7_9STRE|nr:transcription antiterminator [Streptococcus cuniculi]OLF47538.1 ascorbate 6-phosphate lactonase [Streptococcus cuniculi]